MGFSWTNFSAPTGKECNCLKNDGLSAHVQSKNGHVLPTGQSYAPPKVTTRPPYGPKVISMLSSSCLKEVPILIQSCAAGAGSVIGDSF